MNDMDLIDLHLETWVSNKSLKCDVTYYHKDVMGSSVVVNFNNDETSLLIGHFGPWSKGGNSKKISYEMVRFKPNMRMLGIRGGVLKPINDPDFFEGLDFLSELCLSLSKMSNKGADDWLRSNREHTFSFDHERRGGYN